MQKRCQKVEIRPNRVTLLETNSEKKERLEPEAKAPKVNSSTQALFTIREPPKAAAAAAVADVDV